MIDYNKWKPMGIESQLADLYKDSSEYLGPKCPGCGSMIEVAGFCEKCKKRKFKTLTKDEKFGSEKASKRHLTPNKKVM